MITVLGAGAFGTALAISLSHNAPVTLWARGGAHADDMTKSRENARRLPGVMLPEAITVTSGIPSLPPAAICLLAVPTQKLRGLLTEYAGILGGCRLVACCKGVERGTGLGPTGIIGRILPDTPAAMLTGPSFAHDIARGMPTALTLACRDAAVGMALQQVLNTPNLRVYRTQDVIGAELGGALKNVIAIGCGAVIGAGLGESTRAALMTRGFAEMSRMAIALGADPETLYGLSGFGDLALTCTSEQSRNYRYGLSLGRGDAFDRAVTVEGAETAQAALDRAGEMRVDMPITAAIVALIDGKLCVSQAVDMLFSRPLKEE